MHHPYLRGLLLALTLVAAFTLGATVDANPVQFLAVTVGACLAAVPGRILRRKEQRPALSWQRCLRGFLGGFGVALGCLMAGGGWSLQWLLALGTGGVGSLGFAGVAILAALLCAAWGRRRRA